MVGVAEVYLHLKESLEFLMVPKQYVIVGRNGLEFGESFLNAEECRVHILDRYLKDLFNEGDSLLSIGNREEYSVSILARDNEVGFGITESLSRVDILRSFADEGPVQKFHNLLSPTSFSLFLSIPKALDFPSIHTCNESIDRIFAYGGKVLLAFSNPSRNVRGRLPVIETLLDEVFETRMLNNFHHLVLAPFASHTCLARCFFCVIPPSCPVSLDLVTNR